MGLSRTCIIPCAVLALCGCDRSVEPQEATLRTCMGSHARALAASEGRRPSFDEAKRFAGMCGAASGQNGSNGAAKLTVPNERIDTLACAYSEQWKRCG